MTKGEKALAQARALQASGQVSRYTGTKRSDRKPSQVIKTVRGHDSDLQREIRKMAEKGYMVANIGGRKALWSPAAGVFTRKQVWTVTFELGS